MSGDDKASERGILETLLQSYKTFTKIGLVIFPIELAIGIAVGFYRPFEGACALLLMLFFTWVYFDIRKHQRERKIRIVKDDE